MHTANSVDLFAFSPTGAPIPKDVLGYPAVGVVVRANWQTLNPAPARYDWTQVDNDVAAAKAAGKRVVLAFYTGPSTPEWIAAARFSFAWPTRTGSFTMPATYDPAVTAAWNTFVSAAGARYGGNPSVVAVHITGPTVFSAEYHMSVELSRQPGYSATRHLAAWSNSIQVFNAAWRTNQFLISDISQVFTVRDGLREQIAAQVAALGTRRVWFQMDHLRLGAAANEPDAALVESYRAKGFTVGFEFVQPAASQVQFDELVNLGASQGASYLQVYESPAIGPH
jgi:hypothetical protein